jgi:hypothetical protein
MPDQQQFLEMALNLSTYHREHEKFYAQNPLQQAMALQQASRVLLALADRWQGVEAKTSLPGLRRLERNCGYPTEWGAVSGRRRRTSRDHTPQARSGIDGRGLW